jgi:hypothetical protein
LSLDASFVEGIGRTGIIGANARDVPDVCPVEAWKDLGKCEVELGCDRICLSGIEARMLIIRRREGAIGRKDGSGLAERTRRYLSLDDDTLILAVLLCCKTRARHELRDERIHRASEQRHKGRVEEITILLNKLGDIIRRWAWIMVNSEQIPVALGRAGNKGCMDTELGGKILESILIPTVTTLAQLVRQAGFTDYP